jgi:hypothetical protein
MGCDVAYGKIHEFPKSGESMSILENNRDKSQENSNLVVSSTESTKQEEAVISNEISEKPLQTNTSTDNNNNQTISQENTTQQTVLNELEQHDNKVTNESITPVVNKEESCIKEESQKEEIVSSERKYDIF